MAMAVITRYVVIMPVYLDYNATTPLRDEVSDALRASLDLLGNPSSVHQFGRAMRRRLEMAREQVAAFVNAEPIDVVFTSGATEANNAVIAGAPVTRVLVSAIEHPSVLDAASARGHTAVIPVDGDGLIDLAALEALLAGDRQPTLVSVMWVNNETGVVQPVAAIAALAKRHGALFHCDAVQAAGKCAIDMRRDGIDYLTLSAHKIGGPGGVGALIYSHHTALKAHVFGGGQERRRRAGTENLLGIIGFGAAAAAAQAGEMTQLAQWRDAMEAAIRRAVPEALVAGSNAPRVGNTSQIILPGAPAETQLMALDLAGFAVSSGSACSSGSVKPSHVLLAMGIAPELARCAVRVSLGFKTTEQEVKAFLAAWVTNAQRFASR